MALLVISYSRDDQPQVRALVSLLRAGLRDIERAVYWDEQFEPGEPWFDQLKAYIDAAPQLFVFWCVHANTSPQVRREFTYALAKDKRVVPVLLDDTPLAAELAPIHGIDLRGAIRHGRKMGAGAIRAAVLASVLVLIAAGTLVFNERWVHKSTQTRSDDGQSGQAQRELSEAERREAELRYREAERREAEWLAKQGVRVLAPLQVPSPETLAELQRREQEQREIEQLEAKLREVQQRGNELHEAERLEAELRERQQREVMRREMEQRARELREAQEREAQTREAKRINAERLERQRRERALREAEQVASELREAALREAE